MSGQLSTLEKKDAGQGQHCTSITVLFGLIQRKMQIFIF